MKRQDFEIGTSRKVVGYLWVQQLLSEPKLDDVQQITILYWLERKVFILSMKVSILSQIYTQNCQHRTWSSIGICLDILSNTQVSYFYIFVSVSVSSRSVWLLACIINLRRFLVKYLYLNKLNELNHCISGVYSCTEQWKVGSYGPDSLICEMSRLSRPHHTGSSVNFTWGY